MFAKKNKIKRTVYEFGQNCWSSICHRIANDWPQAVLVAAIVTIMHLNPTYFGWLHAVDRYAYVVIGHLSTLVIPQLEQNGSPPAPVPGIAVVGIGAATYEEQYLERTPLNRCKLSEDLGKLYKFKPRLLVVDLDLSPVREPPEAEKASNKLASFGWGTTTACQAKLDKFIREKSRTIETVLMAPIVEKRSEKQRRWITDMEEAGVYFASGKLPVEYGVVLSYYSVPGTLAQTAAALWNRKVDCDRCGAEPCGNPDCAKRQCDRIESCPDPLDLSSAKKSVLNFQAFHPKKDEKTDIAELSEVDVHEKVVFFGAKYGEDDYFLTPVDEKYGVDLHAAAFITTFHNVAEHGSWHNFLAFGVDVLYGLLFGFIISYFWRRYFQSRLDTGSIKNQLLASWQILLLFGIVFFATVLLSWFSLYLLGSWGIWASPVPIAIGMLFESFVSGSVAQAIRVAHELDGRGKENRHHADSGQISKAVPGLLDRQSDFLSADAQNLYQSIKRFFYLDFQYLRQKNHGEGVVLLVLRRLAWLCIVALAFYFMVFRH